ncbi:MAG: DNA primase [Nitrosomonas sp.]|nr:DNA primase [Nitrosomonas sp.]
MIIYKANSQKQGNQSLNFAEPQHTTKSNLDYLISQLRKVKQTGSSRWIACCPSHDDKTPSLAIRDINDKILLKCHAGCSIHEIVSAIGMDISDLFPERNEYSRPIKNPFPAADVLRCIQSEALKVAVIASDVSKGGQLTEARRKFLLVAVGRILNAYE